MHYDTNHFWTNGQPSIVPTQAKAQISNREKLSQLDIIEVRRF